ncbi:MAG: glycoside hydrolase [Uliginosibacterium sp.]|nr:glycoside hydrolase [Uliginosibacterium sp.]
MLKNVSEWVGICCVFVVAACGGGGGGSSSLGEQPITQPTRVGSFESGKYRNVFVENGIATQQEVEARLQATYEKLFYSGNRDDSTGESVLFPVGDDMAFIKDIGNGDIRSEGMSYGMMIAVQMNDKAVFDKLWRFANTYMQQKSGWYEGYFAWNLKPDAPFEKLHEGAAADGEEYFAMALYFAHNRWGSGDGVLNYKHHADTLLKNMVHKPETDDYLPLFSTSQRQILFVSEKGAGVFTDPSYHLPAFYELFARWSPADNSLWSEAAEVSRRFFHRASHPATGLFPDYAEFDGAPRATSYNANSHHSAHDAFRVMGNIAMDYTWFARDDAQKTLVDRQLAFYAQELAAKGSNYAIHTMEGTPVSSYGSSGQIAMLATGAMVSDSADSALYLKALWSQPTPRGTWRYYDGLLHMFALLHLSGRYQVIPAR